MTKTKTRKSPALADSRSSARGVSAPVAAYGLTHAVVDASCAFAVFGLLSTSHLDLETFAFLAVLYNALAFGLQAPLGLIIDKYHTTKTNTPLLAAIIGALFTTAALFMGNSPFSIVILAGLGNALFHIGGGSIILTLAPGRAGLAGLYVAPGAIGVLAGTLLGKGAFPASGILALILLLACIVFVKLKPVKTVAYEPSPFPPNMFALFFLLLLLSIAIRSFVGFAVAFPWKSDVTLLWVLTLSIVAGKGFGGLIADRFGWLKVSAISLIVSAPLLAFGSSNAALGLIGIFLFNITMPVTLVAIFRLFPKWPAFSFGIACMALLAGALPSFAFWRPTLGNPGLLFVVILASAAALSAALYLMASREAGRNKSANTINY